MAGTDRSEDVAGFVRRITSDTGACCRGLLGWDYDEDSDGRKLNEGFGGVRPTGSHQRMVRLIDDTSLHYKLILAPRGSYKSTILQGFVVRQILRDPDVRIAYVCRNETMALEKSTAIRQALVTDRVTQLFGPQEGAPWEEHRFTVATRRRKVLQSPTFSVFSQDSMPTGGRYNFVIADDFIDDTNCTNSEMLKKSKKKFGLLQPFIAKGGVLIVVGTRWDSEDLYTDLEQSPLFREPHGGQLVLGAGVSVVRTSNGNLDLEIDRDGLTFPHMTLDFLRQKLHGMTLKGEFVQFSCQYLNTVPAGLGTLFRRWMFQPLAWGADMTTLAGYLLTDTAVSQKEEGCHSVIAYVGLDASDNLYLLDLRVGHWEQAEFVNLFFEVLETWQHRVNHCGEVWEKIALATSFNYSITTDARARRLRLNTIEIDRYTSERKQMRIQRMHGPMVNKHFFVVDTVPSTFEDVDGQHVLWDPEGHWDANSRTRQPSGELVDQFLMFKKHPKNDIADTLAMVLEYQNHRGTLRRYCPYRPPRKKPDNIALTEQRIRDYRRAELQDTPGGGDWWDRTLGSLHGRQSERDWS